jgi:uncharacterized protein (TIGR02300 family)
MVKAPESPFHSRFDFPGTLVYQARAMPRDLGAKYVCFKCGTKFYDLKKPVPTCPKCGADQRDAPVPKGTAAQQRAQRAAAPREVEEAEAPAAAEAEEAEEEDAEEAADEE